MLAAVFLWASTRPSSVPAKYGILPEMLPDKELSRGNGLLEMSTFMAIILGTSVGSAIFSVWKHNLPRSVCSCSPSPFVGYLTSQRIARVPPSGAAKLFRLESVRRNCRRPAPAAPRTAAVADRDRHLLFWFLGALVRSIFFFSARSCCGLDEFHIGLLGTFLAVGIGLGSLAAGKLSGDHIELGLVPLGSVAMGICLGLVALSAPSYPHTAAALVGLGFSPRDYSPCRSTRFCNNKPERGKRPIDRDQ